jgi:hypothetical protein
MGDLRLNRIASRFEFSIPQIGNAKRMQLKIHVGAVYGWNMAYDTLCKIYFVLVKLRKSNQIASKFKFNLPLVGKPKDVMKIKIHIGAKSGFVESLRDG